MTTNFHAIEVKYHGPTNFKGSRVSLKSARFTDHSFAPQRDTITIPYDHAENDISEMAITWLTDKGYTIAGKAEGTNSYIVLVREFVPLKEANPQRLDFWRGDRWSVQ